MLEPSEIAVFGAGRWGALHAAKLAAMPLVRVAAIVDPCLERARALAAAHPGAVFGPDASVLPASVCAATVATSLPALAPVSASLLERGLHVLVEKPVAPTAVEAAALVATARRRGRLLAVGFVERFNPAVAPLAREPGRLLVARRVGPGRPGAAALHLDWLIHDLDLATHLLGPGLELESARVGPDEVAVRLVGSGGRRALLRSSRRAAVTARRLWLDGRRADLMGGPGVDSLADQLGAFVAAVRGGPAGPLAMGEAAWTALRLADRLGLGPAAAAA